MSETGRILLAELLERTHCGSYLRNSHSLSGLIVLNYHRIGSAHGTLLDPGLWSATEEDFDRQLIFLKQHFDVISPADIPTAIRQSRQRSVMITFDDGYRDNYSAAFPILHSHRLPALFFVSTGFLDQPRLSWWDEISWMVQTSSKETLELPEWEFPLIPLDRQQSDSAIRRLLRRYKQLPSDQTHQFLEAIAERLQTGRASDSLADGVWMTWEMVREMQQAGMFIGGHTVNHPVLARLTPDEQEFEIRESCRRIGNELDCPVELFSFPVGGPSAYNSSTLRVLKAVGIRWAFTYGFGGHVRDSHLPYEIPRLPVESDLNLTRFRALTTLPGLFG